MKEITKYTLRNKETGYLVGYYTDQGHIIEEYHLDGEGRNTALWLVDDIEDAYRTLYNPNDYYKADSVEDPCHNLIAEEWEVVKYITQPPVITAYTGEPYNNIDEHSIEKFIMAEYTKVSHSTDLNVNDVAQGYATGIYSMDKEMFKVFLKYLKENKL
jgi:Leu/Phe-tRNA-protein transferase